MITVKEILDLKQGKLWVIHPKASILDALRIMSLKDVGALPVVDEMGLVGIISERDFIHVIAKQQEYNFERKIDRYMNTEVVTVDCCTPLEECMDIMAKTRVRHLPVIDGKELMGLISYGDVIRTLVANSEEKV